MRSRPPYLVKIVISFKLCEIDSHDLLGVCEHSDCYTVTRVEDFFQEHLFPSMFLLMLLMILLRVNFNPIRVTSESQANSPEANIVTECEDDHEIDE